MLLGPHLHLYVARIRGKPPLNIWQTWTPEISGPQVCATSAFSTEPAQERRFFLKKGSLPPPAPSTPTPYSEIKMSEQEFKACKISSKVYIIISILPERIISLPLQALVPSYLFRNSGGQMCTDTSVRANWQWQALSRPLPLSGQMAP